MSIGDVQASAPAALRVSGQTRTALGVAGAAAGLGILGDILLRSLPWGLNLALWTAALVMTIALLQRWTDADDAATGWIPLALGTAALMVWRDSATLKALDLAALAIILGLAMLRARGGQVRMAGLAHHAAGVAASAGDAAVGAARLLFSDVRWAELRSDGGARNGVAALRGAAIALPLLLVFGSLLASADARFERLLGGVFSFSVPTLMGHVAFSLVVAWLCGGVLRTMTLGGDRPGPVVRRPESLSLGIVEAGIVLGLLDLLFLAFVAVQLPYFFGTSELIQGPGSTSFSEYARRGFFELVFVAGLVLPMLLFGDWIVRKESPAHTRLFRALAGTQVALLFVIMGSGLHRMRLYQAAYGLTELRLYTTAFMLWLGVVFGWFAWTVLRGQRERFAWGALTTALEAIVILHVVNPDATIVRVNASRADAALRFDGSYAASLSADAVPPLLAALTDVRPELRCVAATRLQARWRDADADWRSWSLARGRARSLVARRADELRGMESCLAAPPAPARAVAPPANTQAAAVAVDYSTSAAPPPPPPAPIAGPPSAQPAPASPTTSVDGSAATSSPAQTGVTVQPARVP
jgi:TM2 domain-containing membrane protein YozV